MWISLAQQDHVHELSGRQPAMACRHAVQLADVFKPDLIQLSVVQELAGLHCEIL